MSDRLTQLTTSLLCSVAAACLVASVARAAVIDATWTGAGGNSLWNDPSNWSLESGFPDNDGDSFRVFIDGGLATASSVALNVDVTIDDLFLSSSDSLTVSGGRLDLVGSALVSDAAVLLLGVSGVLAGGTLATEGSGAIRGFNATASGAGTLQDLINTGLVELGNLEKLAIAGVVVNDGNISLESSGSTTDLVVRAAAPATLSGTGTLTLSAAPASNDNRIAGSGVGATLTQGPDHTIRGFGTVTVALQNGGRLAPGDPIGQLDFDAALALLAGARLEIALAGTAAGHRPRSRHRERRRGAWRAADPERRSGLPRHDHARGQLHRTGGHERGPHGTVLERRARGRASSAPTASRSWCSTVPAPPNRTRSSSRTSSSPTRDRSASGGSQASHRVGASASA